MITAQALIAKFQYAYDQKWGYIWGTAGQLWTAADQANLEKTTDSDRANSRKYGSQWIGRRVSDCSGLFYWAFKQLGGKMYHGSNTMWNSWCTSKGELKDGKRTDGNPLLPGTAVFTYNKNTKKRGHVGLYVGNGWVIEAAGAQQGVIRSKVSNKKWVEWGELKGIDYANTPADSQPVQEPDQTTPPTIRKGNKNKYVTKCQQMLQDLGYNLGICGVDGDFGTATESAVKAFQKAHKGPDGRALAVDGVVGPATWWALETASKGQETAPEKKYTVTVKGVTKAVADEIQKKYGGTVTAE